MIIDRIILTNFGLYAGRQEFLLTPPSKEKPVILIGGMNGGGKTTLLDAIHLAFYGPDGQCAGRDKLSYKKYLAAMIHRGADPREGASVEIQFRRVTGGKWRSMSVKRSWHFGSKGIQELVDVLADDEPDAVISEHWMEYIENYLPAKLAGLFFFDGEQIARMAEDEHAAGILETALNSLLGLDLVERLDNDLTVLARQQRKKYASVSEQVAVDNLKEELEQAVMAGDAAFQDLSQEEGLLARLQKELSDHKAAFRKDGGELYMQREQLERERDNLRGHTEKLEEELRDLAAGPTPLLLIKDVLAKVEHQAQAEIAHKHNSLLAEEEAKRDKSIIQSLKQQKLPKELLVTITRTLEQHRPERSCGAVDLYLHPPEDLVEELRRLREVALPKVDELRRVLLAQIKNARENLARAEERLGRIPAADQIGKQLRAIQMTEERIRDKEIAVRVATERVKQCNSIKEQKERAWLHALNAIAETEDAAEDRRRIIDRIPKVQSTLVAFRERVIARRAAHFERLILESFQHLLRKSHLIKNIQIDPQSFRITLTGGDDHPIDFIRLSAGERQLLATAILWGLSKAARRPVPLVIDTPLGRLDSSHQERLVKHYFPAASHQVLLLSTDTEIIGKELKTLRPFVGREYCLDHNEHNNKTTVTKGYFDNHETTG